MNKAVKKAMEMDEFNNDLPDVEAGGGQQNFRKFGMNRRDTRGIIQLSAYRY